jgi:2-hydroxychromene-2-carboxylate isomerase
MKQKIKFYFDFISPYSYLAWNWVRNSTLDFEYIPVSIASIVTHYETKGPAQIEPKRNYLFRDLLRKSKLNNIPFVLPKSLPFNSLYALRLALLETAQGNQQLQKKIIDEIFLAGWTRGEEIGSDDSLKLILQKAQLFDEELFIRMESRESRILLKKNIEEALNQGVFGVPSFLLTGREHPELFWGQDSIEHLKLALSGDDPLDLDKYHNCLSHFQARN